MRRPPAMFCHFHKAIILIGVAAVLLLALATGEYTSLQAQPHEGNGLPPDPFVVRLYYDDPAHLQQLQRYDLWEYNNLEAQYVLISLDRAEYVELLRQGWRLTIDHRATAQLRPRTPLFFYGGYRTIAELYDQLAAVNEKHPTLTELVTYGSSYCQTSGGCTTLGGQFHTGFDLKAIRVTNEAIPGASQLNGNTISQGSKPVFFLMANIHAREITTSELAMRLLSWLVDGYGTNADATWLVDWHEIWIVPSANPDGHWLVELGEQLPGTGTPFFQRKNANNDGNEDELPDCSQWPPDTFSQYGVDLNRNHSFAWGTGGASMFPCDQTYRGVSAASEAEIAHLEALVQALIPDQRGNGLNAVAPPDTTGIFITLHSFGELIVWPWGHINNPTPNDTDLRAIGDKLATYNHYHACQTTLCLYPASGASDDWAYGVLGIPAFTFEVGKSFMPPLSEVDNIQWPDNGPALQYAAKIARAPYQTVRGPDVEDIQAVLSADATTLTITAVIDDSDNGSQPIAEAELSLEIPFWVPNTPTTSLLPADGTLDETAEAVTAVLDVGSLPDGRYLVFIHGQDSNGHWGATSAGFFEIVPPAPAYNIYLPLLNED